MSHLVVSNTTNVNKKREGEGGDVLRNDKKGEIIKSKFSVAGL